MTVSSFIDNLKSYTGENVFNPWRDYDSKSDIGPDAPMIRRNQLIEFLKLRLAQARYILIAEAAGYQGGHFTGIALTCERMLLGLHKKTNPNLILGHKGIRTSRPDSPYMTSDAQRTSGMNEPTDTYVWGAVADNGLNPCEVLLWNIFPFHPYKEGILFSNRTPTTQELTIGLTYTKELLALCPSSVRIGAIGRKSAETLSSAGITATAMRHPLLKQLKRYEGVKKDLAAYTEDKGDVNKIHPEYVMSEIDKLSSDDAVFTVDTGMTCVWGARYLQATGKRHMLGSFNHGSMANALPQAIGAALAYPDRQVVALCGDGGLSMTLGDLETVVQYKLPIKIIVFNNRSLGMVKLEMEVDGLPDWQTNMLNPDFAQVAEAMGMTGFNVSNPEEVLTTLLNAFELDGPVLVNIMTDPNALAMPPKIEFGQMVGFAQSMYKLLINGRSQEVIDTINSNFKHIREVF